MLITSAAFLADAGVPQSDRNWPELPAPTRQVPNLTPRWWSDNALLLTASVGMGHVRAAENLSTVLTKGESSNGESSNDVGKPLDVIDVVEYMGPLARRVYRDGYLKLTSMAPSVVGKLYDLSDTPGPSTAAAQKLESALSRRLERHLIRRQPEVIISTHFLTTRVVSALKSQGKLRCALIQVITDFDAHAFWHAPGVDQYCVAAAPARDRLLSFGVRPEKIAVTGIPLHENFRKAPSRAEARALLNRDFNEPLVLLTLGGMGNARYPELVQSLAQARQNFHTVVVCGKNEKAKEELERLLGSLPEETSKRFTIVGFTNQMPLYMAASDILIGKPGGLTSSEALASGLCLFLVNPIPGQEERNADYLLENGAALRCRYLEQLGAKVDSLLGDPRGLAEKQAAALALGKPDSSKTIAEVVTETALRKLALRNTLGFLHPEHLLARLSPPRSVLGTAVFDLDKTILGGDIGEAVFDYLAKRGALSRLPISSELVEGGLNKGDFLQPHEGENLSVFYRRALQAAQNSATPDQCTGAVYAWMNQALAGLSASDLEAATQKVWENNLISLRPSALSFIASLLRIGHRVAIVSASNQAFVSWVVTHALNPALAKIAPNLAVRPTDVWGISNILSSGTSLRSAILTRTSLDEPLTPSLEAPLSTFRGKAEVVTKAGYGTPVLVAGDSPNDFGMASLAPLIAWVPRGDAPQHSVRFTEFLRANPQKDFCLI